MKYKTNTQLLILFCFVGLIASFIFFSAFETNQSNRPQSDNLNDTLHLSESAKLYGLPLDSFEARPYTIQRNEFLSTILARYHVEPQMIHELVQQSKPIFDVRNMTAGNTYTIFSPRSDSTRLSYLVYEKNSIDYVVYDLRDSLAIYTGEKAVYTRVETVADTINHSLYQVLQDNGSDPDLAVLLANIYGGVIDFYAIASGDWFKIQYERQYVNDRPIGAGKILSAEFSHHGDVFQAFYFKPGHASEGQYYDENGNSMRRMFLKAPLKFSRISSRYSKRRLHPVQKVWKAHLGTDYAAPTGTPIVATANGVVTDSRYNRYNGHYVKIKHNKTYTTQYLHMSRRAVKNGQRIRQGQVIGYVGSTGLATGPHVCYRFWKNGRQVDALKQNFQSAEPLAPKYRSAFQLHVKKKQNELASISTRKQSKLAFYMENNPSLYQYFGILD